MHHNHPPQENHPSPPSEEHAKLMKYLDDFDRQLSSRRSTPNSGLEEQLASVSRAYSQAQEKLLQTEKALMAESVLLQKQRSVIDIYKCVLSEQLDEQGLLYFLQRLEEDQTNRQIHDDIVQLRNILARTRNKGNDHHKLKAELARAAQDQSVLAEQAESANASYMQAQMENEQLQEELQAARQELERQRVAWQNTNKQLEEERKNNQRLTQQLAVQVRSLEEYSLREKELLEDKDRLQQIERVIKSKIGDSVPKGKENSLSLSNQGKNKSLSITDLQGKLNQMAKYKTQYRKLKDQQSNSDFLQREIALLKLFLSEQALQLFRELQLHRQESIQGQLRNLALLQRARLIKLQQCEQDVWKYRLQLLREKEEDSTRKIDPRQTSANLVHSVQLDPVSQFET